MNTLQVDEYVLHCDELYKQTLPQRVIHRCRSTVTGKQYLIKLWITDQNCPISTQVIHLEYKPLFDNEVKMLKQLDKSAVAKYLPVLETYSENSIMLVDNVRIAVAYEIFQPVKHQSIYRYSRMLPETLRRHLLKEIVEFVIQLNELYNLTVGYLHPAHIFIKEDLTPCFMSIIYMQQLNYSQLLQDSFNLEWSFVSPQMLIPNQRYNSQRVDSFQLGVVACYLMCGTVCCEHKNQILDNVYGHIIRQNYKDFWKRIKCVDTPQTLKDMILMLIEPNQKLRIDPFVIKKLLWWQEQHELPPADTLLVIQNKEKQKKQQQLIQVKLRAHNRPGRPAFQLPRMVVGQGLRSKQSLLLINMESLLHCTTDHLQYLCLPQRIQDVYKELKNRFKSQSILRHQNESQFILLVDVEDQFNPFGVVIRLYCLIQTPQVTVAKFQLCDGQSLQCQEKYLHFIQDLAHHCDKQLVI